MSDLLALRRHDVTLCGQTARGLAVRLRPMTEDDWPLLYRWNSDPEVLYYSEGDDVIHNSTISDYNVRSWRAFQRVGYRIAERIKEPPGSKAEYGYDLVLTRDKFLAEEG